MSDYDAEAAGSPAGPNRQLSRKVTRAGKFLLSNVIGVKSQDHVRRAIPPGYSIKYTKTGQAYLVKEGEMDAVGDNEASNEHVRAGAKVAFGSDAETLAKSFGEGMYQYFDFIVYLIFTNFILTLIGFISLIPHFIIDGWTAVVLSTNTTQNNENFYLNSFSPYVQKWWFWSTIFAAFVWTFLFGPLLAKRISRRFKQIGYEDTEDDYGADQQDIIKDKKGSPAHARHLRPWRMGLSYFGFLIVLFVSAILTLMLVTAQLYYGVNSLVASLAVSIVIAIMNLIWKIACEYLTMFEHHYTWSQFKNHHTIKFFVWRILNVSIMFLARYLLSIGYLDNFPLTAFIIEYARSSGRNPVHGCDIAPLADQFLMLLLIDLTLGNAVEIIVAHAQYRLYGCCCGVTTGENYETGRPEFDIAEEYLELLYRQYIVYLGFPFSPLLPLIGVIVNAVEYPLDKYRLLRICKTPPPLQGSMKSFLVFFLFVTAVCSVAMFPYGTGWVLAGFSFADSCPDTVFAGLNTTTQFAPTFIPPALLPVAPTSPPTAPA